MNQIAEKSVRAVYDAETIRVYQAYGAAIAKSAAARGNFVSPPFKMDRMTWIKPSFCWMMYRCGWAEKAGQEHVLAIDITREGFEWALGHSSLSHYVSGVQESEEEWERLNRAAPVRIQWDPERDYKLNRLDYRSIQIGLSGEAVQKYVDEWIVRLEDITDYVKDVASRIKRGEDVAEMLPKEIEYPLPEGLRGKLGING